MSSNLSRRSFLTSTAAVLAAALVPRPARAAPPPKLVWGNLLHLSYNMWSDRPVEKWGALQGEELGYVCRQPYLRFDEKLWRDLLQAMSRGGLNLVVLDLGDAVAYRSHPEIAVKDAWSPAKLREELKRCRDLGLEPIPKLNFSTAHDTWLGKYARMVSTPEYYRVCRELIAEVTELFDGPRMFHLGYDEETAEHQAKYEYTVVRQYELWWHDFEFFAQTVAEQKTRPWIWADYAWKHADTFFARMPKSVVQSNWYYGLSFNPEKDTAAKTYVELERHGFDQIPAASNWSTPENFRRTVDFARQHIAPERLLGFLQTPWKPTLEGCRAHHEAAIRLVAETMAGKPPV